MMTLEAAALQVGMRLKQRGWMLATAESCTGGAAGYAVTAIAGSSAWFDRGFITYSNQSKTEMLGVSEATLAEFGAVSEETAREMAAGALAHSRAQLALSITGIAGPGGGSLDKPVGTVCFAWAGSGAIESCTRVFSGSRDQVRNQAALFALTELLRILD